MPQLVDILLFTVLDPKGSRVELRAPLLLFGSRRSLGLAFIFFLFRRDITFKGIYGQYAATVSAVMKTEQRFFSACSDR